MCQAILHNFLDLSYQSYVVGNVLISVLRLRKLTYILASALALSSVPQHIRCLVENRLTWDLADASSQSE